jgi:hypothetical protein
MPDDTLARVEHDLHPCSPTPSTISHQYVFPSLLPEVNIFITLVFQKGLGIRCL